VILRGGQRQGVAAVGHHDEAGFLAVHELLDHHPRAALVVLHAQGVVGEHGVDGGVGFVQVMATTTPLPAARPSALMTMGAPSAST
jgi:hypothetical protein